MHANIFEVKANYCPSYEVFSASVASIWNLTKIIADIQVLGKPKSSFKLTGPALSQPSAFSDLFRVAKHHIGIFSVFCYFHRLNERF